MDGLTLVTHAEQPALHEQLACFTQLWPEFIFHDAISEHYYHHTLSTFAPYTLYLCAGTSVVAAGVSVPLAWDGTTATLPAGWDAALVQSVRDRDQGHQPTTLCALGAMVRADQQGHGLSRHVLRGFKTVGRAHELTALVAPVRPTRKSIYPLTPMERYMSWQRADGSPFDPWMRIHWQEGAQILALAPESMVVEGTVAEWEDWTKLALPESGPYIVPGALVPIMIDRVANRGRYVEPNVWMRHGIL